MATRKLQAIGTHKTSTPAPERQPAKEPDLVRSFMHDNPAGSLKDEPEEVFASDGEVIRTETPEPEQPQLSLETPKPPEPQAPDATPEPGEAAAPPTGEVHDTAPQGKTDAAAPAQAEQPQAQVEPKPVKPPNPAEPSYDAAEKIYLVAESEPWTREQIVLGLQERAKLQPQAEEAEKFRSLLGGSFEESEPRWRPTLERLAANPQRTAFLEQVLASDDPGLLDYLQRSAEFYRTEVPAEQRPTTQPAAATNYSTASPEFQRMGRIAAAMERQLINGRVQGEWAQINREYPFVDRNPKVKQALIAVASRMFTEDEKAGKSPLECRGLIDAMNEQRVFLDTMRIAADNARQVSAEPQPLVPPQSGAQALLPSTGPGASGAARRAAPERENYHADLKDAYGGDPVKAFLAKHPGE